MTDGLTDADVLDMIVQGVRLRAVLDAVCALVEQRIAGARAKVYLLDATDAPESARAAFAGRDAVTASGWAVPVRGAAREVVGALTVRLGRDALDSELGTLHGAAALVGAAVRQDALRRVVGTHPLTGIPNRTALLERMRGMRGRFGVIMLSVEGLPPINESLGASVGDAVLRSVARRLTALVGAQDTVAHVWGPDFVVLTRRADVDELAERARDAVVEPIDVDGMILSVDVSVGLSVQDGAGGRPDDEGLRTAGVALEHARAAGGHRIGVYDPASDVVLLAPELRRGLDEEELTLAYQPIVRLSDDAVVRYEALLRWRGPRGPVSPESFVPLAEQAGLVGELGRYALRRALPELARVRRTRPDVGLSVNLSARQLVDSSLPDDVAELLDAHAVPPACLTLEVTEGVLLRAESRGWHTLNRLTEMGLRVSLDDFGAGHAQVSYLRTFAFDEVKVDRNLIADMAEDQTARAITIGIIAFAAAAELPLIAEGIERREQADELRDLGATHGQGYLFGAPHSTI